MKNENAGTGLASRVVPKSITRLLPAALLAAGLFVAAPSGQAQSASFAENFNAGSLPSSLEAASGVPTFSGGTVNFPGSNDYNRTYLQTIANYNNTNFVAEVTVKVATCCGGTGAAFFGLGQGVPSYWFHEPRNSPTTYVRIAPDDFGAFFAITTSTTENIGTATAAGTGTHRVRLTWDHVAKSFTAAIQKNYTGGTFTPTYTIALAPDNEFFGDTNTRIFFGGAGNSTFDDLRVVALAGTPGQKNCHGKSVSALAGQFGGTDHAASALGFDSVDALQSLIQGFCGN